MSGYEQGMYQEYLDRMQDQIATFVAACNTNAQSQNPAPTIFFFPGGLGSKLLRAMQQVPYGPPYSYYTIWLDCTIAFGAATDLRLTGAAGDQDWQDRYI